MGCLHPRAGRGPRLANAQSVPAPGPGLSTLRPPLEAGLGFSPALPLGRGSLRCTGRPVLLCPAPLSRSRHTDGS